MKHAARLILGDFKMGLFNKLFGTDKNPKSDSNPPISGGDGTKPTQAAIVNCASMGVANHLIDTFISARHGSKAVDWKRGFEMYVKLQGIPDNTIRSIGVECSDGTNHSYYFDISRPLHGTVNLANKLGL